MRRPFHSLVVAPFLVLMLLAIGPGLGCDDADGFTLEPEPDPRVSSVVSAATRVEVWREDPLALAVWSGDSFVCWIGGDTECDAIRLGIRPRSDDGQRYHDVEDPAEDIQWFSASAAFSGVGTAENLALDLEFTNPDSTQVFTGQLVLQSAADGFVNVDIDIDARDGEVAMLETCFPFLPAEVVPGTPHVVGGGERFDGVDLYGRVIPLAFRAPGRFASNTNESHAPIPFFANNAGLGVLVETERVGAFDVGASHPERLYARFHGTRLPLRVRAPRPETLVASEGPVSLAQTPIVDNIAAHNRYMGLPPMPPLWALAPQQWRNEHAVTVEDSVVVESGADRFLADANKMRALGIPGSLMWIDAPWSTGFNTFEFNDQQFPEAGFLLREAESRGYRVIVWATEHINRSDDSATTFGMPAFGSLDDFNLFSDLGHFVRNSDGSPFTLGWGRGTGAFVDFTNPNAVRAWQDRIRPLLELGVTGFKLDYGETMRADLLGLGPNDIVQFSDGTTTRVQHTRYQRLYHEAFLDVLDEVHGEDRFVITRTGGIYDQPNGVALWPGDLDNDFSLGGDEGPNGAFAVGGLRAAISAGLSASMSGYPLYGSDIGGYRGGPPTTEVLVRWAQFGAVSTIMQLGGGGTGDNTHNPWDEALYDAEVAVPAYQKMARLHMDLLPYLEALLLAATTAGLPPLVPAGVATPSVDESWSDGDAFFLGDVLFAAPVIVDGARERDVRLPPGGWLDYETGAVFAGPRTLTVAAALDVLPLFVRAGGVLPLLDPRINTVVVASETDDIVDPSDVDPLLRVRTSAGPEHTLLLVDGAELSQQTDGDAVTVSATGDVVRRWVVELWLQPDTGPSATAPIDGVAPGSEVASFEEALVCAAPCTFRDAQRLVAVVDGSTVAVRFGP